MMTTLRHRIRDFFWAVRLKDFWLLNSEVAKLRERCERLEAAVLELNPGLNFEDKA